MVSSYSLPLFLRQVPYPMLAEYFGQRELLQSFPFFLTGQQVDYLLRAITELPAGVRASVDREFRDVSRLTSKWGTTLIVSALEARGIYAGPALKALPNQHARAMWFLLNHGNGEASPFAACARIARTQHGSGLRVRRQQGLPKRVPLHDEAACARIAEGLRTFYGRQGRGEHCCVFHERVVDPERHYFLALPEDYAEADFEYDGDALRSADRKPVFQLAYCYYPDEGILEIRAPGSKDDVEAIASVFCAAVLPERADGSIGTEPTASLDRVLSPDLRLPVEPADELASVEIAAVKVRVRGKPQRHLVLVSEPTEPAEFHKVVREMVAKPLETLEVTQVKLRFVWAAKDGADAAHETIEVTPTGPRLAGGPKDRVIRDCLRRWMLAG